MRNIKFRGIAIATKQWVYGSLIAEGNFSAIWETGITPPKPVIHETVGQYIATFDGKEYYEGDRSKNARHIVYDEEHCCFVFYSNGSTGVVFDQDSYEMYPIIGTIHDNLLTHTQ